MPLIDPAHGIAFYPVPKNACTSLKFVFFQMENDWPFRRSLRYGKVFHIHSYYGTVPFEPVAEQPMRYWKFAVLRDPLSRMVSCYRNRVLHHRELEAARLGPEARAAGALPHPDLETFVERLEIYRAASVSIRHHTDPHVVFLGRNPAYFDRLYQMSELDALVEELTRRTGRALDLGREQSGGPPMDVSALSANAVEKLRRFYAEDYDTYAFG